MPFPPPPDPGRRSAFARRRCGSAAAYFARDLVRIASAVFFPVASALPPQAVRGRSSHWYPPVPGSAPDNANLGDFTAPPFVLPAWEMSRSPSCPQLLGESQVRSVTGVVRLMAMAVRITAAPADSRDRTGAQVAELDRFEINRVGNVAFPNRPGMWACSSSICSVLYTF